MEHGMHSQLEEKHSQNYIAGKGSIDSTEDVRALEQVSVAGKA